MSEEYVVIIISMMIMGFVGFTLSLQVQGIKFKNKILEDRIKALEESYFRILTMDSDDG